VPVDVVSVWPTVVVPVTAGATVFAGAAGASGVPLTLFDCVPFPTPFTARMRTG
jgi:hypothetical protein